MSAERDVVVYFQAAPRRRAAATVSQLLGQMELPTAEVTDAQVALALQRAVVLTRECFEAALVRTGLTKDAAAGFMQITPSLLSRQLQNADNQLLSAARIRLLPVETRTHYYIESIEREGLAVVKRNVNVTFEGL